MAARRAGNNRIRGPQSALTDFLASNNISAAQISADYERRRRAAQQQAEQEAAANGTLAEEEEEESQPQEEREETALQKKKRKRAEEKALAKIKESKGFKKKKKGKDGDPEGDENDMAWDMYAKSKPLPGQIENCEICEKRFTVTPYSKTGPQGGLLCTKCSKEQEAQRKKDAKPKKENKTREKRRQNQSALLDGKVMHGAVSLQELCVKKVADNILDVEEFGDLPPKLYKRLSQILSKNRALTARTLDLFLRPNLETIDIYDCGKLEVNDFIRIFSVTPTVENLNLRCAGQFKDEVIDYIIERNVPIKNFQVDAANLVSNKKWIDFFTKCGHRLESLKLAWLDSSLDDEVFRDLIQHCPNLKRLKLKKCFLLGDQALKAIAELKHLEHLSLRFPANTSTEALTRLIVAIGSQLRTLSLECFYNADDTVLEAIHATCIRLEKLRFCENDLCTDAGYAQLFTNWSNPPLTYIDLNSNRSIDYNQPDGTEEPTGLASAGFQAMMAHSGSTVETLDISSCRHIERDAFERVLDGNAPFAHLHDLNISFLTKIDTPIVAAMFKNFPSLRKLTAFGCFNITDAVVPRGVALIGLPNAQAEIEQEGHFDWEVVNDVLGT